VAKDNRMALGSGTSPGGRLVTARRQRYNTGRLKVWLDWFGLKEWKLVEWGNNIGCEQICLRDKLENLESVDLSMTNKMGSIMGWTKRREC